MKKWKSDQNERNVTLSATRNNSACLVVLGKNNMWKVSVPKLSKTKINKIQKLVILNLPRINVHNLNPLPPKRPIDVFRGKFEFGWLPLVEAWPCG